MKKPSLWEIAKFFSYYGLTGFGGVAMLPVIKHQLVNQKKYLTAADYDYGLALSQMLPGATLVQISAYVGYTLYGNIGAIIASLGIFLPASLLMYVLTLLYYHYNNLAIVPHIVDGMNAVIVVIILDACILSAKSGVRSIRALIIALLGFFLYFLKLNAVLVVLISLVAGMLLDSRAKTHKAVEQKIATNSKAVYIAYALLIAIVPALWYFSADIGKLATLMFKTGLLAFGGGYAAIPIFMHDAVTAEHWLTMPQFMTGLTLGQITPGPVIVTAVYIGYAVHQTIGAFIAFCYILIPEMLLALIVLPLFGRLLANVWFARAMFGILNAFVGMLFSVFLSMLGEISYDYLSLIILGASAYFVMYKRVPAYYMILIAIIVEIIKFSLIK